MLDNFPSIHPGLQCWVPTSWKALELTTIRHLLDEGHKPSIVAAMSERRPCLEPPLHPTPPPCPAPLGLLTKMPLPLLRATHSPMLTPPWLGRFLCSLSSFRALLPLLSPAVCF